MFNKTSIFAKGKSKRNPRTIFNTIPTCDCGPIVNECCTQEIRLKEFTKGVFGYGSKSTFNNSGVSFLPTGNFR